MPTKWEYDTKEGYDIYAKRSDSTTAFKHIGKGTCSVTNEIPINSKLFTNKRRAKKVISNKRCIEINDRLIIIC